MSFYTDLKVMYDDAAKADITPYLKKLAELKDGTYSVKNVSDGIYIAELGDFNVLNSLAEYHALEEACINTEGVVKMFKASEDGSTQEEIYDDTDADWPYDYSFDLSSIYGIQTREQELLEAAIAWISDHVSSPEDIAGGLNHYLTDKVTVSELQKSGLVERQVA